MNKAFKELPEDRQRAIVNAAYDEFGAHGYDRASTNAIVAAAGISKGTLFNYFGSKIGLFSYLMKTSMDLVGKVYLDELDHSLTDYLEKYRQATLTKYRAYREHPHEFNFFAGVFLFDSKEPVVRRAVKRVDTMRANMEACFRENNDTSLFIKGYDPEELIVLMQYCLEGYERDMLTRMRRSAQPADWSESLWDDFYRFLDQLRSVFYRKGA